MSSIESALFGVSQPLRRVTQPYIGAGLQQKWNMFSNPMTDDHYLRLDYHVTSTQSQGRPWVVRELVFPSGHEDRMRLRHDFRDKAVANAVENFFVARAKNEPVDAKTPRDFVPLARYFSNQYRDRYLTVHERIARTDVWYGSAAMPPRGQQLPARVLEARLDVLRRYYDGPFRLFGDSSYQALGREAREADIAWNLVDIEEE